MPGCGARELSSPSSSRSTPSRRRISVERLRGRSRRRSASPTTDCSGARSAAKAAPSASAIMTLRLCATMSCSSRAMRARSAAAARSSSEAWKAWRWRTLVPRPAAAIVRPASPTKVLNASSEPQRAVASTAPSAEHAGRDRRSSPRLVRGDGVEGDEERGVAEHLDVGDPLRRRRPRRGARRRASATAGATRAGASGRALKSTRPSGLGCSASASVHEIDEDAEGERGVRERLVAPREGEQALGDRCAHVSINLRATAVAHNGLASGSLRRLDVRRRSHAGSVSWPFGQRFPTAFSRALVCRACDGRHPQRSSPRLRSCSRSPRSARPRTAGSSARSTRATPARSTASARRASPHKGKLIVLPEDGQAAGLDPARVDRRAARAGRAGRPGRPTARDRWSASTRCATAVTVGARPDGGRHALAQGRHVRDRREGEPARDARHRARRA